VSWRTGVVLTLAAVLSSASQGALHAHAGLRLSDPLEGSTLGDTPIAIRLTFSERPDPALSDIRVVGTAGAAYQLGRPLPVPGDPQSISINIRPLDTGVYTVNWQVVSSVDGHTTAGTYAFGVRADPGAAGVAGSASTPTVSLFEIFARWMLIAGLVAMLGAAAATVARFGGAGDLPIAAVGGLLAFAGVVLLISAQARNATVSFANLLNASVGRSLLWRFAAIGLAGAALILARTRTPDDRRVAMAGVLLATLTAMAIHVAGGHAAASVRWVLATIASQWVHFAAVGIWLGGLAALLIGLRGAPSATKADRVRRFSLIASIALVAVTLTGIARSAGELSAWGDLTSTAYGQAVLAKIALTCGIAGFAAVNHWRSVAAAAADLRPLRRAGSGELMLAACALAVAAALGALAPPAAALRDPSGFDVTGADFGTTVRVRLTTPSNQPGPNRFVVNVSDYDSEAPVRPRRVSLRFTPLDDPRIASTTLALARGTEDSFIGSGSHLAFDGRWRITALVEREADAVEVPMEVETQLKPQFVSITRVEGKPTNYMIQVDNAGHVAIIPDPERAGPTTVTIICYDVLRDQTWVEDIVVAIRAGDGPARQQPVTRTSPSAFVSRFAFEPGPNRISVVARTPAGTRMRASLTLDIPR
jgi:copper transport protein